MAKRKKPKIDVYDFGQLDQQSINFIDAKVRSLGSRKAVAQYYKANDTVSEFARTLAGIYFGGGVMK